MGLLDSLMTDASNVVGAASSVSNTNGTITQTERLYTVRGRGTNTAEQGGGNRGTRAYIRLMTTNATTSLNRSNNVTEGLGGANLSASGGPLDAAINGNNSYGGYANFFVTDVRCALDEKLQITETFGDGEVAYYFGRQPIMMNVSGYIFDSADNGWFTEFLSMYGQVMRGTQLARNYELIKLVLPNMYVIGTMTHVDWGQNSSRDTDVQFSFQFMVKQLVPIAIRVPGVPTSNASSLINFGAIPSFVSQSGINTVKSSAQQLQDLVQDPTSTSSQIASSISGLGSGLSAGISDISNYNDGSNSNSFGFTTDSSGNNAATSAYSFTGGSGAATTSNIFTSISANLTGIRASLFSPIYGVLSSLTKLVSNAAGSVSSIFNALTSPVRDIIRSVQDISSQAIGIVNLVNGTIQGLTGQVSSIDNQTRIALGDLTNAAGVITNAPMTIFQSVGQLVNAGMMPLSSGFLQDKSIASLSSGASSSSGGAGLSGSGSSSSTGSASLSGGGSSSGSGGASVTGGSGSVPKLVLLNSGVPYTAQSGASL